MKTIEIPKTITIPQYFTPENYMDYVNSQGVEGVVVTFEDGTMAKIKGEEYCQLHKILDMKTKKSYCEYYNAHGSFDDVIGILSQHGLTKDIDDLRAFEDEYIEKLRVYIDKVEDVKALCGHLSRKEIALKMNEEKVDKSIRAMVFSSLDGKDIIQMIRHNLLVSYKDDGREPEE